MEQKSFDRYNRLGLKTEWIKHLFEKGEAFYDECELKGNELKGLKNWLLDAELIHEDGKLTSLCKKLALLGSDCLQSWAVIWTNLVHHSSVCRWWARRYAGRRYDANKLVDSLSIEATEPKSNLSNAVTALLQLLKLSPIGWKLGQGVWTSPSTSSEISKSEWDKPDELSVLYALYKWSQFSKELDLLPSDLAASGSKNCGLNVASIFGDAAVKVALHGVEGFSVASTDVMGKLTLKPDVVPEQIVDLMLTRAGLELPPVVDLAAKEQAYKALCAHGEQVKNSVDAYARRELDKEQLDSEVLHLIEDEENFIKEFGALSDEQLKFAGGLNLDELEQAIHAATDMLSQPEPEPEATKEPEPEVAAEPEPTEKPEPEVAAEDKPTAQETKPAEKTEKFTTPVDDERTRYMPLNGYKGEGLRQKWLNDFFNFGLPSLKKSLSPQQYEAFCMWAQDAELLKREGISDLRKTQCCEVLQRLGAEHELTWSIIWINLAYNSAICRWWMTFGTLVDGDEDRHEYDHDYLVKLLLQRVKSSEKLRKNAVTALLTTFRTTPIGSYLLQGVSHQVGGRSIFRREALKKPHPLALLYSVYRYCEATEDITKAHLSVRDMCCLTADDQPMQAEGKLRVAALGVNYQWIFGTLTEENIENPMLDVATRYPNYLSVSNDENQGLYLERGTTTIDILQIILNELCGEPKPARDRLSAAKLEPEMEYKPKEFREYEPKHTDAELIAEGMPALEFSRDVARRMHILNTLILSLQRELPNSGKLSNMFNEHLRSMGFQLDTICKQVETIRKVYERLFESIVTPTLKAQANEELGSWKSIKTTSNNLREAGHSPMGRAVRKFKGSFLEKLADLINSSVRAIALWVKLADALEDTFRMLFDMYLSEREELSKKPDTLLELVKDSITDVNFSCVSKGDDISTPPEVEKPHVMDVVGVAKPDFVPGANYYEDAVVDLPENIEEEIRDDIVEAPAEVLEKNSTSHSVTKLKPEDYDGVSRPAPVEDVEEVVAATAEKVESSAPVAEVAEAKAESAAPVEEVAEAKVESTAPVAEVAEVKVESTAPAEEVAEAKAESAAPAEEVAEAKTESTAPAEEVAEVKVETSADVVAPSEEEVAAIRDVVQALVIPEASVMYSAISIAPENMDTSNGQALMPLAPLPLTSYYSIGLRKEWLELFLREGMHCIDDEPFGNRQQVSALCSWLTDAELLVETEGGEQKPSLLCGQLAKLGADNPLTWSIIWINLTYHSALCRWWATDKNLPTAQPLSLSELLRLLGPVAPEAKCQNALKALTELFASTPIGSVLGQGVMLGEQVMKFGSLSPLPDAMIYALYKWAQVTGRFKFTLSDLSRAAIHPAQIFGLHPETFRLLIQGLAFEKRLDLQGDCIVLPDSHSDAVI